MTTFTDLEREGPVIASFFRKRVEATGLCFVATTRSDGWPRVSPMELSILGGGLYVGSMPGAVKARDLQRDPRCCVITTLADKDDLAGEVKLFARAREIVGGAEWDSLRAHFRELVGSDVIGEPGAAHLFELTVDAAAWQRVEGDDWRTTSWSFGEQRVRERVRSGPHGEPRDL